MPDPHAKEIAEINAMLGKKTSEPDDKLGIDLERVAPLYDAILVTFEIPKEEKEVDTSLHGSEILISANPQKKQKKYIEATVVRVGIGNYDANGNEIKMPMKPGDRVLIPRNGGMGLVSEKNGKLFKILRLKELIMVIDYYPEKEA